MAWPLTPFRTMADGSTYWDAALGNALQTAINGLYSGVASVLSTAVDGLGNQAVLPSAYSVLSRWGSGGKVQSTIDHNGFAGGQVIQVASNWDVTGVAIGTAFDSGRWNTFQSGTGNSLGIGTALLGNVVAIGGVQWHGRYLALQLPATSGNYLNMQTTSAPADFGDTTLSFVIEWTAGTGTSPTNLTYIMGLGEGSTGSAPSTYGYRAWFKKATTDTNWQLQYQFNGGTLLSTDSGVAGFLSGGLGRFRIEMHGSATPLGIAAGHGVAMFFINEVLVGTQPLASGQQPLNIVMDAEATSTISAGNALTVSPVRWRYNLLDTNVVV